MTKLTFRRKRGKVMKYRKKPVVVEAMQWTGFHHLYLENEADELMAILYCPYCGCKFD